MGEWLGFLQGHLETFIAVGSAVIAAIGALFSVAETRRQRKIQLADLRQHIDATSVNWGNEAIDTLAEAEALASLDHVGDLNRFQADCLKIASRLSALADRGRLFFPNLQPDTIKAEKESAYRGSRPPILDALIFACFEMRELGKGGKGLHASAQYLDQCRRLVVSELQAHLDPRHRDKIIERNDKRREKTRNDAKARTDALREQLAKRRPELCPKLEISTRNLQTSPA